MGFFKVLKTENCVKPETVLADLGCLSTVNSKCNLILVNIRKQQQLLKIDWVSIKIPLQKLLTDYIVIIKNYRFLYCFENIENWVEIKAVLADLDYYLRLKHNNYKIYFVLVKIETPINY